MSSIALVEKEFRQFDVKQLEELAPAKVEKEFRQFDVKQLEELAYAKAVGGTYQTWTLSADMYSSTVKRAKVEDLEFVFKRYPIVSRGVEIRANEFISRGYEIKTENKKAEKWLTKFLKDNRFEILVRQAHINADIYGNGYIEIMYNAGNSDIKGLKVLHPKFIDVQRDPSTGAVIFDNVGGLKGYVQRVGQQEIKLRPDQIIHIVFRKMGDEVLGYSLVEPALKTIERAMNIEEGVAQGMYRHGFPQLDIEVGDENNPPTKAMIDDIAKSVEDLNSKNEFVHSNYIKAKILESSTTKDIGFYPQIFIKQIVSCLGVPEPLILGTGENSNKSIAEVQLKDFRAQMGAEQKISAVEIEDKLFKKLAALKGWKDDPELEWNEILPEEETAKTGRVATLFEKQLITRNEAREILKFPPTPFPEDDEFQKPLDNMIPTEEKRGSPAVNQPDRVPKQEIVKTRDQKRDRTKRNVEKKAQLLAAKIKKLEELDFKEEIKRMNEELLEYSREIVKERKKQGNTPNNDLTTVTDNNLEQVGQNAIQE